jgi:membrane protease YdiL (CAAX protease family)
MWTSHKDLGADAVGGIAPGRRTQAVEVSVFLFLIVPSLVLSLFVIRQGGLGFVITAVATILRDLGLVVLIFYFLWRNGEGVARIGWSLRRVWKELILGVALFVPVFFGAGLLEWALLRAGLSSPTTPLPSALTARGAAEGPLAVVLVAVVAVAEETIFRGYLLLRFQALLRSPVWAVLLSSLIFSLGHGYEGSAGLVTVGVMGAAFAVVYLWRGSLVAPVVMHFLQDFLGIVLLPLLGAK